MRVILIALLLFFTMSSVSVAQTNRGFARSKNLLEFSQPKEHRFWISGNFSGILAMASSLDPQVVPFSKFGVNIGAMAYKFIGFEASLSYNIQPVVDIQFADVNQKVVSSLGQADISLSLILQPSIMLSDYPLIYFKPYAGAGINFAFIPGYSYVTSPVANTTTFDFSPIFKAGIRFSIINFLIGVKAEYLLLNSLYEEGNYNLSNFTIGVEIGAVF